MKDLVFLVADKDMEMTIRGLLNRPKSLKIRDVVYDLFVHPLHDAGCFNTPEQILRTKPQQYQYAIVLFDHNGSGQEQKSIDEIQQNAEQKLETIGWDQRIRVIVIQPELEIWVWSDSPKVDECLGWANHDPKLRTWLETHDLWRSDDQKPHDPKKAVEEALRFVRESRSSVIYRNLAEKVSFQRCTDPSFQRLVETLQTWFPIVS